MRDKPKCELSDFESEGQGGIVPLIVHGRGNNSRNGAESRPITLTSEIVVIISNC